MIKIRLQILADHLEELAARAAAGKKAKRTFSLWNWFKTNECGTAACAVGEATTIPELKKRGLRLTRQLGLPSYKGDDSWFAVDAFFGLARRESYYLFHVESYAQSEWQNPGAVAVRIREFIKNGGAT